MTKNNNNITIALGIICIILAAGLITAVAHYRGQQSASNLEDQVTSLQNQADTLNDLVSDYEEQIDDLTSENNVYASIINLEEYAVLIGDITYQQAAGDEAVIYDDKLTYAGYLELQAESTSDTTYIQVSYTYGNVEFNQTFNIGNKGPACLPVLPDNITITLGNTETATEIETETIDTKVTIKYIF